MVHHGERARRVVGRQRRVPVEAEPGGCMGMYLYRAGRRSHTLAALLDRRGFKCAEGHSCYADEQWKCLFLNEDRR